MLLFNISHQRTDYFYEDIISVNYLFIYLLTLILCIHKFVPFPCIVITHTHTHHTHGHGQRLQMQRIFFIVKCIVGWMGGMWDRKRKYGWRKNKYKRFIGINDWNRNKKENEIDTVKEPDLGPGVILASWMAYISWPGCSGCLASMINHWQINNTHPRHTASFDSVFNSYRVFWWNCCQSFWWGLCG